MKTIVAIDPGTTQSAIITMTEDYEIQNMAISPNEDLVDLLIFFSKHSPILHSKLIIEMVACYGMPVGRTVFETCVWIGRFIEAFKGEHEMVYRKDIKIHFCNATKAKDSNIRQALVDRFGEPGTKKNKGKLYGIKKDLWSALAVGTYYLDTNT